MARVWQLLVRADGDTAAAQKAMRGLQRDTRKFGRSMTSMGKTLTMGITAPIVALGAVGVKELMETMAVTKKTDAVFKSMGSTVKVTRSDFDTMVSSLSEYSAIEGDIVQGNANIALSFKALASNPQLFKDTMKAAVDMSAALGIDTKTAVIQLGKAMQNGAKGAGALAKNGTLAKDDIEKLQAMAKAGVPMWKQQAFILDAVNKQYAGQGKNVDPIKAITLAIKDTAEAMAVLLLPSILAISKKMQDLSHWVQGLSAGKKKLLGIVLLLAAALGPVLMIVGQLATAWAAIVPVVAAVAGVLGVSIAAFAGIVLAIGAVVAALIYAYTHSDTFRARVDAAFKAVARVVKSILAEVKATITTWVRWATAFWDRFGADIKRFTMAAWGAIKPIIVGRLIMIRGAIKTVLALLRGDWSGAWNGIKMIAAGAWQTIKGLVSAAAMVVVASLKAAWALAKAATTAAWGLIKAAVKAGVTAVGTAVAQLPAKVSALAGAVSAAAVSIGSAIISGIMSGLRAGADQIVSYVASLGGRALEAIKSKLHIKSPSRVFADEVGTPIVDGITKGMEVASPRLWKAAAATAKSTVSAATKSAEAAIRATEKLNLGQALVQSLFGLEQAKSGTAGSVGGLQAQAALMTAQYNALAAHLKKQGKKLGVASRQQIADQMTGLLNGVRDIGQQVIEIGKQAAQDAIDAAQKIKDAILGALSGANDFYDRQKAEIELIAAETGADQSAVLRQISANQYQALKDFYGANAGSLTDSEKSSILRQMIEALNASKIPEAVAAVATASADTTIPKIPAFARGGITSGPSLAGEAGREAVVPLGSSAREASDRARVMRQAGLGGGVEIHIHTSGDPEAAAQRVAQLFRSGRVRMGGAL